MVYIKFYFVPKEYQLTENDGCGGGIAEQLKGEEKRGKVRK